MRIRVASSLYERLLAAHKFFYKKFWRLNKMLNEIQVEDLPCYECLCLATCRGRALGALMKCNRAFNYVFSINKGQQKCPGYPYTSPAYKVFFKYLRLYSSQRP